MIWRVPLTGREVYIDAALFIVTPDGATHQAAEQLAVEAITDPRLIRQVGPMANEYWLLGVGTAVSVPTKETP